jgi:HSP20 family molecular chaperone IbpA
MFEQEFVRTFDEIFEDLLITRWRGPQRVRNSGKALVLEEEQNYRVKIALPNMAPEELDVEVSEWRLTVRMPAADRCEESVFDFAHRVDIESVTARLEGGILEVLVPKARGRKIKVG